jgi:AraC-like DNA-binding protein
MRRLLEPGKSAFSGREALLQWQKLLLDICASPQSKGGEALPDPRLSKACLLIEARAAEADPQWEEVCRQAGLGYENLRVLFRRHLGTTPFRYREKRRIERAVFLARTRKYTARQAAEMLGYYDEAHFSKAFKRATGATFSRFAAGYGAA